MKEKGMMANLHPLTRLLLLVLLSFISLMIVTVIGVLAMVPVWGQEMLDLLLGAEGVNIMSQLKYARFLQILTHLGLFIIPSVVFAWLVGRRPLRYLEANRGPGARTLLIGILIMLAATPMVSLMMEINLRLSLPEFLAPVEEWMRQSEQSAEEATKMFLNVETWQGLLFNILMIAIIPALGEEFIFRGIILKTLRQWSGSAHLAVWVSALLFSAMHMQFFGFLPRFLLGLLLGYMFVWSRNIWVPVVAHFFNNALAVVFYFLFFNGYTSFDMEKIGEQMARNEGLYLLSFASLVVVTFLFWVLYDKEKKKRRLAD